MNTKTAFKPVVLLILDGVGITESYEGNAVTKAKTPFLESAWDTFPHTSLQASGKYVGLPPGVKGNSEVGHMNLGSGRIVYQELPRINKSIENGMFYRNKTLTQAVKHAKDNNGKIHLAICFSNGGTHSHIKHLEATLDTIHKSQFKGKVVVHAFTDGRDTPPKSAPQFFKRIHEKMQKLGVGEYGTVMGRYYAMDRNESWDRTQKAYLALINGEGLKAKNWREAINKSYSRGETDEFIQPTIITPLKQHLVQSNDSFIFLNFRSDRAIQLTTAFTSEEFSEFNRGPKVQNLYFAGMSEYAKDFPKNVLFQKESLKLPLGRICSEHDFRQLRIAESEKFPHVTYFFNGGRSIVFGGEDRVEIPSPDVPTYDEKPEMSIFETTQVLLEKLALNIYDIVIANFANGDMVAHTGDFEASKRAMVAVDKCTDTIVQAVKSIGGTTIITADHGNAEELTNPQTGDIDTEHSINPVPFIVIPPQKITSSLVLPTGELADVTPTILNLLRLPKPSEMTGKSLI